MEPNQAVNPSAENTWIPQGIPTGVFVPNNQTPAQTPVTQPVQNTIQQPTTPVVPGTPIQAQTSLAPKEGPLDKILKWLARFFAKVMWQPDPITGAPNAASQALQKSENIVGKVRGAANDVVAKASNVAGKAVSTATNVATQAAQQVQQIIPPPQATPITPTPVQEAPVASAPVVPTQTTPTPIV